MIQRYGRLRIRDIDALQSSIDGYEGIIPFDSDIVRLSDEKPGGEIDARGITILAVPIDRL